MDSAGVLMDFIEIGTASWLMRNCRQYHHLLLTFARLEQSRRAHVTNKYAGTVPVGILGINRPNKIVWA